VLAGPDDGAALAAAAGAVVTFASAEGVGMVKIAGDVGPDDAGDDDDDDDDGFARLAAASSFNHPVFLRFTPRGPASLTARGAGASCKLMLEGPGGKGCLDCIAFTRPVGVGVGVRSSIAASLFITCSVAGVEEEELALAGVLGTAAGRLSPEVVNWLCTVGVWMSIEVILSATRSMAGVMGAAPADAGALGIVTG
jgi:hypothetical protein